MRQRAFGLVVLLNLAGAAVVPACSTSSPSSTVVSGSGLATSCSTDDDCVAVYFGDVCGFCTTDVRNAAIASSAETAYQNAFNAAESHCPPNMAAGSCIENSTITTCAMGTCALTTCSGAPANAHACTLTNDAGVDGSDAAVTGGDASTSDGGSTVVSGSGLATSCSTDDDCVSAYFGDVCGFCTLDVPNAAIASSAQATYQDAVNVAESHCPPSNGAGLCATNRSITTCAMGTCALTTCTKTPANAHTCPLTNDAGVDGSDAAVTGNDASTSDGGSTVVSGSDLATSCTTDDDCVSAYFGDVCGFCALDVPNAAIASSAQAAYQSAVNVAESRCPPKMGGGSCIANRTITTCASGMCSLTTCSTAPADAHACTVTTDAGVTGSDASKADAN